MTITISKVKIAEEYGTDLSSRSRAATLRSRLESWPETRQRSTLDFEAVRTISHSFADEAFAVLLVKHGEKWFTQHVTLENLSPDVRLSILEAIAARLAQSDGLPKS